MTCTICRHPERDAINAALIAQEPLRSIAARTGTSLAAVFRHKQTHLPLTLSKAAHEVEVVQGMSLLERIQMLDAKTWSILGKAEAIGEYHIALGAIREIRANTELLERALKRDRYEASTRGQIERESRRADEQARVLRAEHPMEKLLLADLKRRNQLREATIKLIQLYEKPSAEVEEGGRLESPAVCPPQLTGTGG